MVGPLQKSHFSPIFFFVLLNIAVIQSLLQQHQTQIHYGLPANRYRSIVPSLQQQSNAQYDYVEYNYGLSNVVTVDNEKFISVKNRNGGQPLRLLIRNTFIPNGVVSTEYYNYTLWRLAQRFLSATTSVFGTQSLLLAIGYKKDSIGVAAATLWVLKDALGKISRIVWASKHGRKFDSDAKKWRFRSSVLFATGNAFEILTYLKPSLFLVVAAFANAMKQTAMLTSSATRNAIYKSFSRNSDNIGDITAKGEAQIAVIDLFGILMGIFISRKIDASRSKLAVIFIALSVIDLFCIFNEIKSVVFLSLNFETTGIVLKELFNKGIKGPFINAVKSGSNHDKKDGVVISPNYVAAKEQIFLPTVYGERLFKVWSSQTLSPASLQKFVAIFKPEDKILVTMEAELISSPLKILYRKSFLSGCSYFTTHTNAIICLKPCVLLHTSANHFDVFRALVILHKAVHDFGISQSSNRGGDAVITDDDLVELVSRAKDYEKENLKNIINALRSAGWDMSKFMYGSINSRVEW